MTLNQNDIQSLPGPILVIGAGGFIGANLFRNLLKVRKDVYGTIGSSKSNWRLEEIPKEQIVKIDLLELSSIREVLAKIAPATIFHLAAYGAYSFENTVDKIYRTNFLSMVNLFELLSSSPIHAFVHAGSSSEYGTNSSGPAEDATRIPNSHYAVTKSAVADLISYYGKTKNFPCVNLRLYSVYGPYEDTSRLIPTLIARGLKRELPPFVNPNTARDFIYVEDVCNAFVAAALKMDKNIQGNSYNIGTGTKTTIQEIANTARTEFKIAEEPRFGSMNARAWDLSEWYANPEKGKRELGLKEMTPFHEGFKQTIAWWKEFLSKKNFEDLTALRKEEGQKNSVTAIIACYKDGQAIPIMYERLVKTFQKIGIDYQIVFVNDCSPDNSREVIQEISEKDHRVLGICHSRNFGSQAAFRSGLELATSQSCVLLDGDLQDPPELIEEFVEKWRQGWDIVFGRRIKREMPRIQELMFKSFYVIFDKISFISIPRNAGDFSLIDRRVVQHLLKCQERDSFLRGLRAYVGFKQIGVDYLRPERLFGTSTNNFLKNIQWAKKGIFSFSTVPLALITFIGTVLLLITTLIMIGIVATKLFLPNLAPSGITTTLLAILFFGSINLFAVGILGEYLAKIIEEVKQRPPFIRSELIKEGKCKNI